MRPTLKLDQVFFLGRGAAPPFASVEAPPGIELVSRLQQVTHGRVVHVHRPVSVKRWGGQPVAAADRAQRQLALQQIGFDLVTVMMGAGRAGAHQDSMATPVIQRQRKHEDCPLGPDFDEIPPVSALCRPQG